MPYGKKSPAEMGYKSPMKKESAKQERKNLLTENPVDNKASAMRMGHESPAKMGHESPMKMAGSWMSKHSKSALHMGHSPVEMGHESPAKNLGHGMKSIKDKSASKAEKKAHMLHHSKQRMASNK